MTLRLSLQIEGDTTGSKEALEETARSVEDLAQKAERAADPLDRVSGSLDEAAENGQAAARGVAEIGDAVDDASGKFTGFGTAVTGALADFAGGLVAGSIQAGLELAAGAALSLAENIISTGPQIEANLTQHAELIERIRDAYSGAAGASGFGATGDPESLFAAQQNVQDLHGTFQREQNEVLLGGTARFLPGGLSELFGGEAFGRSALGTPFESAVRQFREELREGRADVISFRDEISTIAKALPLDDDGRGIAERLMGSTDGLAELQERLGEAIDVYRGLTGDNEALAAALGGTAEEWASQRAEIDALVPRVRDLADEYANLSASLVASASGAVVPRPGFAVGGYTGDGAVDQVAGVVHSGEFVINADATARHRPMLEAINSGLPGYAAGGIAGAGVATNAPAGAAADASTIQEIIDLATGSIRSLGEQALSTGDLFGSLKGAMGAFGERLTSLAQDRILYGLDGESGLLGGLLSGIGFDVGGYTGDSGRGAVAGVVHGQEFVINAAATARHRPMLEAINSGMPGFASGGYVGGGSAATFAPNVTLNVYDQVGVQVREQSVEQGPTGEMVINMVIDRAREATRADALSGKWDNVFRANGAGPTARREG